MEVDGSVEEGRSDEVWRVVEDKVEDLFVGSPGGRKTPFEVHRYIPPK